jgi:TolB-like protein/Flp pilus assembly protein TadD
MDLLVYLADRPGEVVSSDELLEKLWPDRVVTEGSVYRCIGELREVLEQGKVTPIYIETIPKKGYRLRSRVIRAAEDNDVANTPSPRVSILIVLVALLAAAVSATLIWDRVQDEPLANDPARPSIAILALRPIDFEEGNDYFSEGLSEDLITRLARIPELRVISRSSSFSFMQTDASIPEIAGKLGVEFIIDGSVRLNDNRVRITAQLIDAEQDSVLWSDSYDRKIDDVFYVQAEVSSAIVAALKTELGLHISMPTQAVAQTSPEARDAYLRGRHLIVQRSPVAIEDAAREFRTAIALDPEYAPAHAELAVATLLLTRRMYGGASESEALRIAEPIAARAMQLDPDLPEAHLSAGLVEMIRGRHEASLPYLRRAIQLSPSHALAYSWLGSAYDRLGRYREYFETTKTALALDPLSQPSLANHIQNLIDREELAEAERQLEKLASVSPRAATSLRGHLTSLDGNWANAVFAKLDALRIDPGSKQVRLGLSERLAMVGLEQEALAVTDSYLHYTFTYLGKPAAALRRAAEIYGHGQEVLADSSDMAIALAGAGQYARARPLLEQVWRKRDVKVTRSGLITRDGVPIIIAIALIAARKAANEGADVGDLLAALREDVRRTRGAGLTRSSQYLSVDFEEGVVAYLSGDRRRGLALIGKAAADGYFIPPAEAYYDFLRHEPAFIEIVDKQARRQMQEREKLLAVVCTDSPYSGVWEPAAGTCEDFSTKGGT